MQFPFARTLFASTAVSALALGSLVAATGAGAAGTTTTFTLGAGALSISAPASAALGAASPGAALSNQLGAVTVTDARANLVAAWTATASSSTFVTGAGGAGQVIPLTDVAYASGVATASSGLGVMTPGQTLLTPATLTTPVTAYSLAAGVGNNSATWNPTITITVPAAAVAGTYTGTITHSVA
jgi:hypothetical protein